MISASENELSKPSILRFLASSSSSLSVVLHCTGRNWTLPDRMMEARAGDRACFLAGRNAAKEEAEVNSAYLAAWRNIFVT